MKSIIFIAPPAAGKGTLSRMIEEKYHLPHISTGDLLRDAVASDTAQAKELKQQMESGVLISDEIILDLLTERIKNSDCDNGYILDGFPRTLKQAEDYEKILKELGKTLGEVIYVGVSKDVAMKRITGRVSCPKCKAVYNEFIEESKPKVPGVCDRCGSLLTKRSDDNEKTFQVRFDTYMKSTEPLIQHYEELGKLHRISNDVSKELAFKEIETILNGGN